MPTFDDDVDLNDLIAFAKAYAALGWSAQAQLDDLLAGSPDGLNPNAVREIDRAMGDMHVEIREAVDNFKP
jgi:hypothetical protein